MRTMLARAAALAAPVAVLVVPKCPLCILPLLALAGVGVPAAGPLLDAIAVALVGAFTFFVIRTMRSRTNIFLALAAATLLITGRLFEQPILLGAGALAMLAVAVLRTREAKRTCGGCVSS